MGTPISNELKSLFMNGAEHIISITVTPTEGNSFTITNSDIMLGTFAIDRTAMEGSSLNLGACVASELSMTLNNFDGRFDNVVWNEAEMVVTLGAEGSLETLPMGVFYVDGTPKSRDTINVTALDGMTKFDKSVYDPDSMYLDSWSLYAVISLCCTKCGVTLSTDITGFPNTEYEFNIDNLLDGYSHSHPEFTFRHLLSSAVALLGKIAWMNEDGELEIGFAKEVDVSGSAVAGIAVVGDAIVGSSSSDSPTAFTQSNRFSSDYDSTINISGINFTKSETGVEYSTNPTSKYFFDLTGNAILEYTYHISGENIVSDISLDDVLENIHNDMIPVTYRPISLEAVPCPYIFPMDSVLFEIKPNGVSANARFATFVTSIIFRLNGHTSIASQGVSPANKALTAVATVGTLQNSIGALEVGAKSASERITDLEMSVGMVSQGTTNGWAYRKWESGRYECWYHQNYTVDITTQSGNVYYGTITSIDYPITFTSTPVLILTVTGNSGCWVSAENTARTARTGNIWVYRGVSTSTVTVSLNIYIQGSWK